MELIEKCGLNSDGPYDNSDIIKISNEFDVNICVVNGNMMNQVTFKTQLTTDNFIYIYKHNDHYDLITSMTAFTSRVYYCNKCNTGYNGNGKKSHKCINQINENGNIEIADKLNNKIIHKKQYKKLTT